MSRLVAQLGSDERSLGFPLRRAKRTQRECCSDRICECSEGSFQRRTAMNTRKEPAMATTPETFVDALNSAFGKQTTQRSAHAKGIVLLGKFVPSAEAASVSKALHFKHEVPVTVRFSANSGIPKIADG